MYVSGKIIYDYVIYGVYSFDILILEPKEVCVYTLWQKWKRMESPGTLDNLSN